MNKTIYRIANAILTGVVILGSYINVQAASEQSPLNVTGNIYYVSTTGNDSNPGTLSSPFRTFVKANSVLSAGDTLYILPGIYNEALRISHSGAQGAWITVKPSGGAVIIDLRNSSSQAVLLQGSFIDLSNLEIKGSNDICVHVPGSYIRISGLIVHACQTHGIHVTGQHVEVTGNSIYATSLANQSRTMSGGWGSGIKIGLGGNDVLVEGNTTFNNYGEGITSTRGSNVVIRGNKVYDNFSANIYVDNSFDIWVEKNLVLCHANSGFENNGIPASGISLGEEYYSGWGAQLNRVTVKNNIVAFCKNGVYYHGADSNLTNSGLKSSTITYNTFWGSTNTTIGVIYGAGQSSSLIANNIIWQVNNQLVYIENSTGLTFHNNLWKVSPPAYAIGTGDRIGDPVFLVMPGYSAETFVLSGLSPAIGGAMNIGVAMDYFGNQRGPSYEMGALQFLNIVPSPNLTIATFIGGNIVGAYDLEPSQSARDTYPIDSGPVKVASTNGVPIIAALRDAWKVNGQIQSFAQLMGLPNEQLSDIYLFPAYNNINLDGQLRFANVDIVPTTVTVTIAGVVRGSYPLAPNEGKRVSYALDAGPVEVKSSNGAKIIAALRDAWKVNGQITSFVQMMGLPQEALSDTYLFPAYNNVNLDGQLRFANVDTVPTTVTVTIAGVVRGSYLLAPNEGKRVSYALDAGPVEVKSSNGAKIIAALRDAWKVNGQIQSFAQLMGLPNEQLSDIYLLPAYNNINLDGQLRFANVDIVPTTVTVTIAGVVRGSYPLAPNEGKRVSYALDAGPVEVKSSNGAKIIAALRDAWKVNGQITSFVQMMGLPQEAWSTIYWFPAYNNINLDGQLRFGVP